MIHQAIVDLVRATVTDPALTAATALSVWTAVAIGYAATVRWPETRHHQEHTS